MIKRVKISKIRVRAADFTGLSRLRGGLKEGVYSDIRGVRLRISDLGCLFRWCLIKS